MSFKNISLKPSFVPISDPNNDREAIYFSDEEEIGAESLGIIYEKNKNKEKEDGELDSEEGDNEDDENGSDDDDDDENKNLKNSEDRMITSSDEKKIVKKNGENSKIEPPSIKRKKINNDDEKNNKKIKKLSGLKEKVQDSAKTTDEAKINGVGNHSDIKCDKCVTYGKTLKLLLRTLETFLTNDNKNNN